MPTTDPIEEIHAVRDALAKESGYDPEKIAEAARKRQAESGRKAVTLPARPTATLKKKLLTMGNNNSTYFVQAERESTEL